MNEASENYEQFKGKIDLEVLRKIKEAAEVERSKRPITIAIIGKTGTGKTSTINSLFGTDWPISHFQACTQVEKPITLSVPSPKGKKVKDNVLKIYDMPGLGEDIDADKRHFETYKKVLPLCDVVAWLIKADTFDLAEDQEELSMVSSINSELVGHIVIGINQCDLIYPFDWINDINLPSDEQETNIQLKGEYIQTALRDVCPELSPDRIIPYAALKRYQLDTLFRAMIDACPETRKWMLGIYMDNVANFLDLVNPKYRKLIK